MDACLKLCQLLELAEIHEEEKYRDEFKMVINVKNMLVQEFVDQLKIEIKTLLLKEL